MIKSCLLSSSLNGESVNLVVPFIFYVFGVCLVSNAKGRDVFYFLSFRVNKSIVWKGSF